MGPRFSRVCRTPRIGNTQAKAPTMRTNYSREKVQAILSDYVEAKDPLLLDLVVESLFKLLPQNAPESNEIWSFGEDCFNLAEINSYKSGVHSRLAQLLESLGLSNQFRGWDPVRLTSIPGPDEGDPDRYVSYNSFLAHLYEHRIFPTDPTYAMWAMRAAFEENRGEEEKMVRSAWILGAAQWILWHGQSIFNLLLHPALFDVTLMTWPDRQAWDSGPLYTGSGGLSLERWQFWKRSFQDILQESKVTAECKEVSIKAIMMMNMFERNMMF
ncbi:hypothetical protein N7462_003985 [Penicillium macrosclerotiorum]|uniref:uncharacterized protein n=1 Tax=Penicillium macrosclerotiorum TaxID=303699 RepID=UPI002546EBDF|nr:uncharacterized protein N7462_003985 [Penicillium macrosclerotiorum]KAJ5689593.1 hypothetical protein N7462_003985 [Penicillium macrosclerotiorum]